MRSALDIFRAATERGRKDPIWWMENVLRIQMHDKAREIVDAIFHHDKVTVQTAPGIGKTYILGGIALHWIFCEGGQVYITGTVFDQIKQTFWAGGVHAILRNSLIPPAESRDLQPGLTEWALRSFCGIQSVNASEESSFHVLGRHAPKVLLIVDEAAGVPDTLFAAFDLTQVSRGVKGAEAKILLSGNPFVWPGCTKFKEANGEGSQYHRIKASAYDSPNVTGECDIPGLTGSDWIEEKEEEWGKDSMEFQIKVMGEYWKEGATDRLIPETLLIDNMKREKPIITVVDKEKGYESRSCGQGMDYARMGDDETVSYIIRDGRIVSVEARRNMDEVTAAAWLAERHRCYQCLRTELDTTGLGIGVYDCVVAHHKDINIGGVSFNSKSNVPDRYNNIRTEMAVRLRDALRTGTLVLDGKVPHEFFEDCRAMTYENKGTKIALTPKDILKKTTGRSPDHSDAAMLAIKAYQFQRQETLDEKMHRELVAGMRKLGRREPAMTGLF